MGPSAAVATVLITGALATAGVTAVAESRNDRASAFVASGADVTGFGARDAHEEFDRADDFSVRRVQRVDDEDSDSERRRGRVGRRDDKDSERRNRRVGTRDRNRDNPFPARRDTGVAGIAFDHGFNDGYDRGLEDGRDRNRFDPVRHRDYRSADRGFESRFGSREQYRIWYRDGFRDGYERGYRDGEDFRTSRTGRIRWPWPF